MEKFKNSFSHYLLLLIVALIFVTACQSSSDQEKVNLEDIPTSTPKQLISFDHADSIYFSHLGYSSVTMINGDVLIPERGNTSLVQVDVSGNLKKVIRRGRGPGEILDAQYFTKDRDNNIYLYDQKNKKVISFNLNLNLINETVPAVNKGRAIIKIYPMADSNFIYELKSFEHFRNEDKDPAKILAQYNSQSESLGNELILYDRPYARNYISGIPVGGFEVPYADGQLIEYNNLNKTLLILDTRTNIIAEMNSDFDTLKTIQINLPTKILNSVEKDSLKAGRSNDEWKSLENLLPEYKAAAKNMMFHNNKIWVETYLGENHQKWLVLNLSGEVEKIVNLPKESMLMHISDHHLGVRIDDVTFALFEPVDLN